MATRLEPSWDRYRWRSGRPLGAAVHGTASGEGVSRTPQPEEIHCFRSLPLGQASHVYRHLVGDPGLDSGKSASLTYSVMGGISDDLFGPTPGRRARS